MKLKKYKKHILNNKYKVIISILIFMLLIIGVGYSSLVSNLSITGNILVKGTEPIIGTYEDILSATYLSDTYRDKIKTITLNDSINIPNDAVISWDIGEIHNGQVMAFLKTNTSDNTMYDLYIQGDGHLYSNPNSSKLFYDMPNLESINNLTLLDTSKTTDMSKMFAASYKLTTLDLSNFDTSEVTTMFRIFAGKNDNEEGPMALNNIIGIEDFDMRKVTTTRSMFLHVNKIGSYDLSNWETPSLRETAYMFATSTEYNSILTSITFGSGFDTSNVFDMKSMFSGEKNLDNLDLSGFNTSKVTDMSYMFSSDNSLTSLNVSGFNTSKVIDMSYMFSNNYSLTSLNVSGFNTSNVTSMKGMFLNTKNLTSIDLSNFDTHNVEDMSYMFYNQIDFTSKLASITFSNKFNTSKVTNMSNMFANNTLLTNLDLSNFDTSNVTDMESMFARDKSLTILDLSNFNTSKVTNMHYMFSGYYDDDNQYSMGLTNIIGLEDLDTSNVTNMAGLFLNCANMVSYDLSNWDTRKVTTMRNMFNNVNDLTGKLTTITLGANFKTDTVTDIYRMFADNPLLTNLNLSNFNTSNVTEISGMFDRDYALTTLDLSNFVITNVSDISKMFVNCRGLNNLRIDNMVFDNVSIYTQLFHLMPTKANGAVIHVKDTTARDWILNLTSDDRPSDWDTTNVVIG